MVDFVIENPEELVLGAIYYGNFQEAGRLLKQYPNIPEQVFYDAFMDALEEREIETMQYILDRNLIKSQQLRDRIYYLLQDSDEDFISLIRRLD